MNTSTLCASLVLCGATLAQAESITVKVIDREGKPVADAVVVAMPSVKTGKTALPQATVAQEKMQFSPAVSVAQVGSKLRFVNNDSWDHHVRGTAAGVVQFAGSNPGGFELRLEGKTDGKAPRVQEVTLTQAGVIGASLLGCYLHSSMRGHVYVSDSPWAVKTNAQGEAKFTDLPFGPASVKVWQADQLQDLPAQNLTVAGAAQVLQFQLQVVPRRPRGAPAPASTAPADLYKTGG